MVAPKRRWLLHHEIMRAIWSTRTTDLRTLSRHIDIADHDIFPPNFPCIVVKLIIEFIGFIPTPISADYEIKFLSSREIRRKMKGKKKNLLCENAYCDDFSLKKASDDFYEADQ